MNEVKDKKNDLWTIRRTIKHFGPKLTMLPGVQTVCLAKKEVAGSITPRWSISVIVSEKADVEPENYIPGSLPAIMLDGSMGTAIETDVVESAGIPIAFGLRGGHLLLSHDNEQGALFTASIVGGRKYAITNSHVVTDVDHSDMSGRVYAYDTADRRYEPVGTVVAATPIFSGSVNDMDAALIRIDEIIPVDRRRIIDEADPVIAFDYFRSEDPAQFFYRAGDEIQQCQRPIPVLQPAPVVVEGITVFYEKCWRLQMVTSGNREGHSGSLIFKRTSSGLVGCGILFAGIEGVEAWAFSAQSVITRLQPFMT